MVFWFQTAPHRQLKRGSAEFHADQGQCGRQGRKRIQQTERQCLRKTLCRQWIHITGVVRQAFQRWHTIGYRPEVQHEKQTHTLV